MKVLFTSDLDRTLIFSKRSTLPDIQYNCIETLDDRNISYISTATYAKLTQLHDLLDFVPVTTRSLNQYKRLTIFHHNVLPKLAIVANGGVILQNGKIDEVWQQHITKKMATLPLLYEQLPDQFAAMFTAPFVLRIHEIDSIFFNLIIDNNQLSLNELRQFQIELERYEWTCYLQGRKLYVLPRFLTKGAAVQYIKSQHEYDWHVAAGDSLMDLSMLELADTCYIPQHGELVQNIEEHGLPIMNETSSNFSDACLQEIMEEIAK